MKHAANKIIRKFSDQKTLPHIAIRVSQLARDDKSTMEDFEKVIKLDPILVTRLLRLVNSPYFGLTQQVDSIAKAVIYAGVKNLRNLVAVESVRGLYSADGSDGFSRESLWYHTVVVSILAEMIARRIWGLPGEDVFLAGILHDIGLVVIDQVDGESLREVCEVYKAGGKSFIACEEDVLNTNHCEIALQLAADWNLPEDINKAIANHHSSGQVFPLSSIQSVLQLAEYMACKLNHKEIPGMDGQLEPHLASHVREKIVDYKVIIRDFAEEMSKAKKLFYLDK